ncbi:unnamed protein product, partial [Pleuronectes platessa]
MNKKLDATVTSARHTSHLSSRQQPSTFGTKTGNNESSQSSEKNSGQLGSGYFLVFNFHMKNASGECLSSDNNKKQDREREEEEEEEEKKDFSFCWRRVEELQWKGRGQVRGMVLIKRSE